MLAALSAAFRNALIVVGTAYLIAAIAVAVGVDPNFETAS